MKSHFSSMQLIDASPSARTTRCLLDTNKLMTLALLALPRRSHITFGGAPPKHAHFLEVGILAYDHEPVAFGIVPNGGVASLLHAFQRDLACSGKVDLQERHNAPRKIFIEQQFHVLAAQSPLMVAAMRSRSAA